MKNNKLAPTKTTLFSLLLILSLTTFLLSSCEAHKEISVTVVDAKTQNPIDSVFVKINAGKNGDYDKNTDEGFTNNLGEFKTFMMIGCSFGCYDIYIEYSKSGYETKKELNITEGIIQLNPE